MRHLALALPQGSAHKDTLSSLILKYSENGVLNHLRQKWFTSHDKKCQRDNGPPSLHVSEFNGHFVVLLFAVIGSVSLAFLELLCYSSSACKKSRHHHHHGRTFCQTVREEVKMAHGQDHSSGLGCNPSSPGASASSSPLMRPSATSPNLSTKATGPGTPYKLQQYPIRQHLHQHKPEHQRPFTPDHAASPSPYVNRKLINALPTDQRSSKMI